MVAPFAHDEIASPKGIIQWTTIRSSRNTSLRIWRSMTNLSSNILIETDKFCWVSSSNGHSDFAYPVSMRNVLTPPMQPTRIWRRKNPMTVPSLRAPNTKNNRPRAKHTLSKPRTPNGLQFSNVFWTPSWGSSQNSNNSETCGSAGLGSKNQRLTGQDATQSISNNRRSDNLCRFVFHAVLSNTRRQHMVERLLDSW